MSLLLSSSMCLLLSSSCCSRNFCACWAWDEKKTSQLENIHHSCLSVYLSHRHYICSSLREKPKKKSKKKTLTCCLSSSSLRLLSSSCASRIRLTLSKDCNQQIFKVLRKEIAANVFLVFGFSNPLLTRSSRSFSLAAESARPEKREKSEDETFYEQSHLPWSCAGQVKENKKRRNKTKRVKIFLHFLSSIHPRLLGIEAKACGC